MLDARNFGSITAGLVDKPEIITTKDGGGKIIKMRVAVPFSSNDPDDRRGFFDVTYFATDDTPNTKFVLTQIQEGNFKKGTTLQFLYRLQHDRWEKEGKSQQRVILVAENVAYAGFAPQGTKETVEAGASSLPERF